jgi:hypothetical protein
MKPKQTEGSLTIACAADQPLVLLRVPVKLTDEQKAKKNAAIKEAWQRRKSV